MEWFSIVHCILWFPTCPGVVDTWQEDGLSHDSYSFFSAWEKVCFCVLYWLAIFSTLYVCSCNVKCTSMNYLCTYTVYACIHCMCWLYHTQVWFLNLTCVRRVAVVRYLWDELSFGMSSSPAYLGYALLRPRMSSFLKPPSCFTPIPLHCHQVQPSPDSKLPHLKVQ